MIHDFTRFGEIPLDAPWLLNVALFLKRQFWFDAKADACRTRFLVEETKEQQAIRVPRELQSFCMDVHVDLITIPAWTKPFSAEVLAVCQEVYSVMVGKLRSDFVCFFVLDVALMLR